MMNQVQICFLELLRAAVRGSAAQVTLADEQWQTLYAMAAEHKVTALIAEAVKGLPQGQALRRQAMVQVINQTQKTGEFRRLYAHLRENGITPLVVKGIVCRGLYPMPDHRISADEDLLIPEGQYEKCHEMLLAFGMHTEAADRESAYEVPYRKAGSALYIELHKHLFPPESGAYGGLNRFFADAFGRAQEVDGVLTLRDTEHMLYLLLHAYKHFLHSGFGIRQVCDTVLFAESRDIQWETVVEALRQVRAEKFAAGVFDIGEKWLGFDCEKAGCGALWREMGVDGTNMLRDILDAGIYGSSDPSRQHSSTITLEAASGRKRGVMAALFPDAKALAGRYPYLNKHPYLLPAAWAQRFIAYAAEVGRGRSSAAEAVQLGSRRVALLREYGITQ